MGHFFLTLLILLFYGIGYFSGAVNMAGRTFVTYNRWLSRVYFTVSEPLAARSQPPAPPVVAPAPPAPAPPVLLPALTLSATSAVAVDLDSGQNLFAQNADYVQPIASITKLMTALVFLDHNPGWDKVYQFKTADRRESQTSFFAGDKVKIKDLFAAMLIASDNSAVAGLVSATGLSESEFVAKMNTKAAQLGLTATRFVDPTGLDEGDVSTARDVAWLARQALAHTEISQTSLSSSYNFTTQQGKHRRIYSTDKLLTGLKNGIAIEGGKTGYIIRAGYCFVGKFNYNQQNIITVVLGAGNPTARFSETTRLLEWVYQDQGG